MLRLAARGMRRRAPVDVQAKQEDEEAAEYFVVGVHGDAVLCGLGLRPA